MEQGNNLLPAFFLDSGPWQRRGLDRRVRRNSSAAAAGRDHVVVVAVGHLDVVDVDNGVVELEFVVAEAMLRSLWLHGHEGDAG